MVRDKTPPIPRWRQRSLRLELMNGLSKTTIIELAEPLASRRVPPQRDLDR